MLCRFWGDSELVVVAPTPSPSPDTSTVTFDHSREISIAVTEEFLEFCSEGALSIEVYGHQVMQQACSLSYLNFELNDFNQFYISNLLCITTVLYCTVPVCERAGRGLGGGGAAG